uniref:Global nitrogen transcriptional regulator n=2 Tax=Gracilariopsis TaxID=2781 RepID=A0A1C9CF85_9FLOR|nr:global nitrogen transcriptional regulator [Gracilariopsis lemaneiformis]YP_009294752.1 global nitrogen transcriptional regulator [Gracilariopsis chorda]AJO68393.1 global nitrogen transcriptional regulator [Gracilariopsis lemaneiformis]AML79814.1 global nitrogen transcriptional regulator [Gracilariopsis lemaneiformis]AOM67012.1 global nitrogen transcriptional regulator [Gracilariopsis chorda]UAD88930.1 global nitrogen transcriptional regulator [Gracilariopsis chorda]
MNNKWVQLLLELDIPFYIYKLNKGDSIISKCKYKNNSAAIILYGTVYTLKMFTNGECICIAILNCNNIIDFNFSTLDKDYVYYKVIALEETYLINFCWWDFISIFNYLPIAVKIFYLFRNTLKKYEMVCYVISHKSIKYRVIQLLVLLCQEFGTVNSDFIKIPFEISQTTISHIIGSNIITVNKIMRDLIGKLLIKYIVKKKTLICYFSLLTYLRNNKIN